MSNEQSTELPLWVQDREQVIANEADVEWRSGKPDYSYTNQFLEKERKHNHAEGSLNVIAHNFVKTFEMEATHKTNPQQWLSVVTDKFRMSTNGGTMWFLNGGTGDNLKEILKIFLLQEKQLKSLD